MYKHFLIFSTMFAVVIPSYAFAYAQHPGAYSSPHYAKKSVHYSPTYNQQDRFSEKQYQKISQSELNENSERSKHQEIDISGYPRDQVESYSNTFENYTNQAGNPNTQGYHSVENNEIPEINNSSLGKVTQSGRAAGFMETAGNFLNGRGGQMLADIAREVISRSTGASSQVGVELIWQVLSLNLTNLVILVILKALILAAGMFGAGAWSHGYGRSIESDINSQWVSGAELDLWASYLQGQPGCLSRASCINPALAKRYYGGADIVLTAAKLMNSVIPYDKKYEKLVEEAKEAAAWGASGMNCEERYKC